LIGFERQWAQIGHGVVGSNPCGRNQHQAANGSSTILFSSSKSKSCSHSMFTHRTICLSITKAGLSGTASKWTSCSFPQCGHVVRLRLTVVASICGFYHAPDCGFGQGISRQFYQERASGKFSVVPLYAGCAERRCGTELSNCSSRRIGIRG
jgi:hypothetical protein